MYVGITAEILLIFEPAPYNFSVLDVGLPAFSGLIGALIGEVYTGLAIDFIAKRYLKQALVAAPVGLIMFGVSIQFGESWVTPLVGQGIYIFGIEITTTVIQTYILECYPRQGPEASLVFNLFRNLMSYTSPFFLAHMLEHVHSSRAFGLFGAFIVFFFPFTIGVLMWRGKQIRDRGREPGWSRD